MKHCLSCLIYYFKIFNNSPFSASAPFTPTVFKINISAKVGGGGIKFFCQRPLTLFWLNLHDGKNLQPYPCKRNNFFFTVVTVKVK